MQRVFWFSQAGLLLLVTGASLAYRRQFTAPPPPRVEQQQTQLQEQLASRPVRPLTYWGRVRQTPVKTECPPAWPYDPNASPASKEERRKWLANEPQWVTARDPATGRLYQFAIPPNGPMR